MGDGIGKEYVTNKECTDPLFAVFKYSELQWLGEVKHIQGKNKTDQEEANIINFSEPNKQLKQKSFCYFPFSN